MRNLLSRTSQAGLIATVLLGCWAGPAAAQIYPPQDPVEVLRQALNVQIRDPLNKAHLDYRRATLERHVKALRTLGQLRRALALHEWRDQDRDPGLRGVDEEVRQLVADRLAEGLRRILKAGNQAGQLAAIAMISEMGTAVRAVDSDDTYASQFAPDLAILVAGRDLQVAAAAAKAMGRIHPDPTVVAEALNLARGHFATAPVEEQRAGAEALTELMRGLLELKSNRSTTGVRISREDVVTMGKAVVPIAQRGLGNADAAVRRDCLEAIHLAATVLGEEIPDPLPAADFPPVGRPLTPDERDFIDSHRRDIDEERQIMLPLAEVLGESAPLVAGLLRDEDRRVRYNAARTLEAMAMASRRMANRAASIPQMEPTKTSREERPPADGQRGVAAILVSRPEKLPEPAFMVTAQAAEKGKDLPAPLRRSLQEILPELTGAFRDPDWRVRLAAVEAVEAMGSAAAPVAGALVEALSDCNRFVRWAAARTLGNLASSDLRDPQLVVAGLIQLLTQDCDLALRMAAAEALGDFHEEAAAAVSALTDFVNRDDVEMRIRAIQSLIEIGTPAVSAVPALIQALENADVRVRRAAAIALDHFGPAARSAVPALEKALNDPDAQVRDAASSALLSVQ